jgi:small subunit ribosomal protein S1
MSWGRVNHPSEVFKVGDSVTVKVLKYNAETERVSLGMKQTQEDPWNHVQEAYPLGKKVSGKVMSITDYGAFVELEPGVEGLIHVSEMSWTKKVKHPSKVLEVGNDVECQVLEVDSRAKRISLGLKQLEPDPWALFTDKYKPGDRVSGKVRSLTDYGVFVGIEDGVDGMVHKTDLSWTLKVGNPGDLYQKGDDVEAIILSINHDEKKVSLGVKQIHDDPWVSELDKVRTGQVFEEAVVTSVSEHGIYVSILPGVDAFISNGEVTDGLNPSRGDKVRAEIANIDSMDRRITMSMRDVGSTSPSEQGSNKGSSRDQSSSSSSGTLGDLLKQKFGDKLTSMAQQDSASSSDAETDR